MLVFQWFLYFSRGGFAKQQVRKPLLLLDETNRGGAKPRRFCQQKHFLLRVAIVQNGVKLALCRGEAGQRNRGPRAQKLGVDFL